MCARGGRCITMSAEPHVLARRVHAREVQRLEDELDRLKSTPGAAAEQIAELGDTLRSEVAALRAFDAKALSSESSSPGKTARKAARQAPVLAPTVSVGAKAAGDPAAQAMIHAAHASPCEQQAAVSPQQFALLYGPAHASAPQPAAIASQASTSAFGCWDNLFGGQNVAVVPQSSAPVAEAAVTAQTNHFSSAGDLVQEFLRLNTAIDGLVHSETLQLHAPDATGLGRRDSLTFEVIDDKTTSESKPTLSAFSSVNTSSSLEVLTPPMDSTSEFVGPGQSLLTQDHVVLPPDLKIESQAEQPSQYSGQPFGMLVDPVEARTLPSSLPPSLQQQLPSLPTGDDSNRIFFSTPTCVTAIKADIAADSTKTKAKSSTNEEMMSAAQKKKMTRAVTKELITTLDSLLPAVSASRRAESDPDGPLHSCGARALGRTGRSLLSILHDAAKTVAQTTASKGFPALKYGQLRAKRRSPDSATHALRQCAKESAVTTRHSLYREMMLSSRSMLAFEVHFPDCGILAAGAGFVAMLEAQIRFSAQNDASSSAMSRERARDGASAGCAASMLQHMTLYDLINHDDVQLLWMFITGRHWIETPLAPYHQLRLRLAPVQQHCAMAAGVVGQQDLFTLLCLVATDPASGCGIFIGMS